jgi:DNA-binding NtrC family response regulator
MGSVLILDSMADAARWAKRVLETAGHEVFAFTRADEALAFLQRHHADAAILDLRLGHTDGLEALALVRRSKPRMPVMILTGAPTLETARQAKALGAAEYCTKPIDIDDLQKKVAALLSTEVP